MFAALVLTSVFLSVVLVVWGVYTAVVQAPLREQQKIVGYRLDSLLRAQQAGPGDRSVELFKQELLSSVPTLQRLLLRVPRAHSLQRALRQADWRVSVSVLVAMSAGCAAAVGLGVWLLWANWVPAVVLASLGACAPYLMLVYRRKKRLERFLAQFPDAIDLMARAVRAGHAIVAGFDMIAEELDDPVGEEFRQVHDEQKFGLPLHQVLANLQERVPLLDVRMLSTAIQIQREVGGNLAEVLDNIAHTIRERFKIHRQIRVYTAQGRLTGYILAALPIFLGLGLMAVNPGYFKILFEHEAGSIMIGLAALLQILGYFWIRKIVNIKI